MKIISFVWNKNYIYIFIVTIILLITNIYDDHFIDKSELEGNGYFIFLSTIFNMIGQFLTIIFFYIFKKEKIENKSFEKSKQTFKKINYVNKKDNFIVKNFDIKKGLLFRIIIICYISLIEIGQYIYNDSFLYHYLRKKISKVDYYYEYNSLEPLSLFILYHIIFYNKININKYQQISFILVIIILLFTFFLNLIKYELSDNFYYLINVLINNLIKNLKLIMLKYLIEYYYFDGFYLNGYAAFFSIIFYSLEYFLKQYYKIGKVIKNIFKIIFSFNIVYLPIYIVFDFVINIYLIIIISDNPVYFGFIRLLKLLLQYIYKLILMILQIESNKKILNNLLEIIILIFLMIAMFIYCEFLQINFAGINKDTKINIQKRADNEIKLYLLEK